MSKDRDELLTEVREAFRLNGQAGDAMDQAASEFLGVHRTDTRLLDVLQMSGRMSAGELARAGHLSPAAVTAALDRLERAGYVRRLRDALAVDPAELYQDEVCEDYGMPSDQWCYDAVRHRPVGAINQPLIHWINRPTFQQLVEVQHQVPR